MQEAFNSDDKEEVLRRLVERSSHSSDLECEDALHRACAKGWLDVAGVILLNYEVGPDVPDFFGSRLRPIHVAAKCGQIEAIDFLLVSGGNLEAEDAYGNSALHHAFQNKQWSAAEYLITRAKANLAKKNIDGITPLIFGFEGAVSLDSPEAMRNVIRLYSESTTAGITIPYWILEQAWTKEWKDELACLVRTEASKGSCGNYNPVLITVAGKGNVELFEFLLQHVEEADESAVDLNGNNTLMVALQNGHGGVAKRIIEKSPNLVAVKNMKGESSVRLAVRNEACDIGIVEQLVKNGANPDEPDQNGNTPLVSALRAKNKAVVEYLVKELKCDLGFRNKSGDTPLSTEMISALYEKDTDRLIWLLTLTLEANDRSRAVTLVPKNALNLACRNRLIPVIEMLIQKFECDPLKPDVALGSQTVLHSVFQRKDAEIARVLLAHKMCSPNHRIKDGMTPLEHADSNAELLSLLERGNNPHVCQARKPVKVFVVGNPSCGKSSLVDVIRASKNHEPFLGSLRKVKQPRTGTAGVVSFKLHHRHVGSIILYDCAGHQQYHPGLAAILERQVECSPAIFVVVVDVNQKNEEILKVLMHWTYFLNCVTGSSTFGRSHVIIVGSKADQSSMSFGDFQDCCISWINNDLNGLTFEGGVMLDCRKMWSNGLTNLLSILSQSCVAIRSDYPFKLQFEHLSLYAFCIEQMPDSFSVSSLKTALQAEEESSNLPQGDEALLESLMLLHKKGLVFYLESEEVFGNSYVVTELNVILHQVFGRLFAPSGSPEYLPLNINTGMVPLSHLEQHFFEPQMILLLLQHLSLAVKIPHTELLFVPGLVGIEKSQLNGLVTCNDGYCFGWLSEFKEESPSHLHFIPFFLQMMQLKIVDMFVKQYIKENDSDIASPRRHTYNIWENGIHWVDKNEIECVIEVSEERRAVLLLIACPKGREFQSVLHRFQLLGIMKSLQDRFFAFCSHHLMTSLVANSELFQYPNLIVTDASKCPIQDLRAAVLTGRKSVEFASSSSQHNQRQHSISLNELLIFDSYLHIPHKALVDLLKQECKEAVPKHLMTDVARMFSDFGQAEVLDVCGFTSSEITQLLPEQTQSKETLASKLLEKWKANQLTLGQLKIILDRFTIFAHVESMSMVS